MADSECREWTCEDCHRTWVDLDVNHNPPECFFCESNKVPMPGGLKPIRPKPPTGE